jgi:hypothetical protein
MSGAADAQLLVDHHCHGIVAEGVARNEFEALLSEADGPGRFHGSLFDTQIGHAVRRICGPVVELPADVDADGYLSRREELGSERIAEMLLADLGIGALCVDTGLQPGRLTPPARLGALAGGVDTYEITRLEAVAESVVRQADAGSFATAFRSELERCVPSSVGFKSVAAYRCGLDLDPGRPSEAELQAAVGRWLRQMEHGAAPRCEDPVIIRGLIWTAIDLGLPLQFHVGYGDVDVDLHRSDPLLLTPLLRATAGRGVPIMLLHNYPFHRNAAYLAQVFDHVFVDVGLALHNVGSRASAVLAELLELAPFGAVLFSSDAFGLPELYRVAVTLFRRALGEFLDAGLRGDFWGVADAERIAALIGVDNARRVYRLEQ